MSLKALIAPPLTAHILGDARLKRQRDKFEHQRQRAGTPHIVEFFHDPADPYSQLLQTALPRFEARYAIQLVTHHVGPPNDGAAPEPEKLAVYALKDTARLAKKAGIDFTFTPTPPAQDTATADARREQLGHYLGGMLYYGGEWYWGLDRLHYLEARLTELGARHKKTGTDFIYPRPTPPTGTGKTGVGKTGAELHWYLSFRSPYTAIVPTRVKALADAYGAELKLRFVLPMVMRDLPVPKLKRRYIPLDTAREARHMGIPYGRVCDPVGKPVERGYSLLPWAREQGRGYEYAAAFLHMVWAEGVNAGSDKGMQKIIERAGLNWDAAKHIIGNEDWRTEEEANRAEMMDMGIWGVPSFRVGKTITWGQDRLWVIENALKKTADNK